MLVNLNLFYLEQIWMLDVIVLLYLEWYDAVCMCAHTGWSQPGHVWWGAEDTTDGSMWKQPFGHSEVPAQSRSIRQPQGGSVCDVCSDSASWTITLSSLTL